VARLTAEQLAVINNTPPDRLQWARQQLLTNGIKTQEQREALRAINTRILRTSTAGSAKPAAAAVPRAATANAARTANS
jgi:hypothetical protein